MNTKKANRAAPRLSTLGMERALAENVWRLSPDKRLYLAAQLERWARQLRFSVEIRTPTSDPMVKHYEKIPPWLVASLVNKAPDLTPPAPEVRCAATLMN